jgi:hypothetical protein
LQSSYSIRVTKTNLNISGFISENSVGEHIKFRISGTIVGHDLPTNGACCRGAFLEIYSSSAVRLD